MAKIKFYLIDPQWENEKLFVGTNREYDEGMFGNSDQIICELTPKQVLDIANYAFEPIEVDVDVKKLAEERSGVK